MSGRSPIVLPVSELRIESATDVAWADIEKVFGTRGDPSTCWCQFFKVSSQEWKTLTPSDFSAALERQATVQPGPGILAYVDDEPVGWCGVERRVRYPRILSSRIVTEGSIEDAADESVWSVTCFVVRVGYRRAGVSAALASAAVEHARRGGARVIEGYPVDPAGRKVSSADLYHGALSVFEGAGFTVVARPTEGRALVRLEL